MALSLGHEPPPGTEYLLWPICEQYFTAWARLHGGRIYAMGMGGAVPMGLQYSEISRYARDTGNGGSYADLEDFVDLVCATDTAYLNWYKAQNERKR